LQAGVFTGATAWSPGLYSFPSGCNFNEGTVTFNGNANDNWVVQVQGNLNVANNVQFVYGEGV